MAFDIRSGELMNRVLVIFIIILAWPLSALARGSGPTTLGANGNAVSFIRPFASKSVWNTPVANLPGISFTPLGTELNGFTVDISPWIRAGWVGIYYARSSDPTVKLYYNPNTWTNIANGIWKISGNSPTVEAEITAGVTTAWGGYTFNQYSTADVTGSTHTAPPGYHPQQSYYWTPTPKVPISAIPAPGADSHIAVFQPNGWVLETMGTIRMSNGNIVCMYASFTWSYSNGSGFQNGRRASMISNYAGVIRNGELTSGTISHAMSVDIGQNALKRQINWPAYSVDMNNRYTGTIPYGALLALPPNLNIATMGLKTPFGRAIAKAAKIYGMYVVDASSTNEFIINSEVAASDLPAYTWSEQCDLTAIVHALQLVTFTAGTDADPILPTSSLH